MKIKMWIQGMPAFVTALAFIAGGSAEAATPAGLNGQIGVRPLTPQEIKTYSLTGLQRSGGLTTVGLGQPVYLEALANIDIPAAEITSVTWALTGKPIGSTAALTNSPLGSNVPLYRQTDQLVSQLAGRSFLRPDKEGQYTVVATIQTVSSGTTNVTQKITAGTYMGANTCALCHSGGAVAPNTYESWVQTPHATAFTNAIDGWSTDHFGQNCISCHVVGFDAHPLAVNGGFDDVAQTTGWTLPAHGTNGNFAAMPENLRNLANIQCENCHGPGSAHAFSLGNASLTSVSMGAGACSQCHDSLTHHYRSAEWNNSVHASAVAETGASCARCHTAQGFVNFLKGAPAVAVPYEGITCATCHDPHDAGSPHQLRAVAGATLMDGTVVTDGGAGTICMQCHISRQNAATYVENTSGSSRFGPHNGPQSDMLAGVNAVTYGKFIPSSAHRDVVKDSCVGCHMQAVASTNAAFTHAGGHTFSMRWDGGTPNNTADDVEMVGSCAQCHGNIETFNFARQDYDGDGIVEGAQTEVKGLMDQLGMLLPPLGQPTVSVTASYTRPQLRAAFNYKFVSADGSYGVHNLSYAVGLLKASIADLTGDGNNDGLPDEWQIQYFGSANHPNAAPNATPQADNVPNWLKYALGLNPTVPGMVLPDGVVWANAGPTPGGTDTIQIYTAAEVAFNTEVGKTYQLQAISTLGGGWQDVGAPVAGTGSGYSFVTPARHNTQQFFRVLSAP